MSRYNLVDEKWIPVRFLNGGLDELGIMDALIRSKEIQTIEDGSPLVVASIYRFLLAVLYRALKGPTDNEEAKELFRHGISCEKVSRYLERWRDRFWLLDESYPFGQIPDFKPVNWRAWTVLAAEHNADNAKVLFDHVNLRTPGLISPVAAIRWLLSTLTFSVSCGKSELSHTGTAPSATGVVALPLGRDLHDTLLFSLVPQNRKVMVLDLPLWERAPDSLENLNNGIKRSEFGLSDRYVWRSRAIRLAADDNGAIDKVAFASGVGYKSEAQIDPMMGYRIDEKRGKLPLQLRPRGFWRDYDSLLPDESNLAPGVISHATMLGRSDSARFPRSVMIHGQANDKAKIEFWRMERFELPRALAGDYPIRGEIRQLLVDAEDANSALWSSCRMYARSILSRGDRDPEKKDVVAFIKQMPVAAAYWSLLEARFHEILSEISLDRDTEDVRACWLGSVREALSSAWGKHAEAVSGGDAWAIRALMKAEVPVRRKLSGISEHIKKLNPEKEEE